MTAMIRPATPADAAAICGIYNDYIVRTAVTFETEPVNATEMAARIAQVAKEGVWLVCEEDGVLMGYAYAHQFHSRAAFCHTFETTVYVAPAAHRHHIGRALMRCVIDHCRERKAHLLVAVVTSSNERSIAFHRALGYEVCGELSEAGRKFDRWHGVTYLQMRL